MARQLKKQKFLFKLSLGKKKMVVTKPKLQWAILILLVASMIAAQVSGLYPFVYNSARCDGEPLEVRGPYYRIPVDSNYGIHVGSDYSRCFDALPTDLQRDPTTKAEIAKAKQLAKQTADYDIYLPRGFNVSQVWTHQQGDGFETSFFITTATNHKFHVREMKKSSDFSYTNLCSKPLDENWSGTIIGSDSKGRKICKTNPSKYIDDYIVGVNIGRTAVMLQTKDSVEDVLNTEAAAIFSAMELQPK